MTCTSSYRVRWKASYEMVFGGFAITNQTEERACIEYVLLSQGQLGSAHLALASLTLTRGLAKSSLNR